MNPLILVCLAVVFAIIAVGAFIAFGPLIMRNRRPR